jgi:hypothetical protein
LYSGSKLSCRADRWDRALLLAVGVVVDGPRRISSARDSATSPTAPPWPRREVRGDSVYSSGLGERVPIDRGVAGAADAGPLPRDRAYSDYPGLRCTVRIHDDRVVVRARAPLDQSIHVGGITGTLVGATGACAVQWRVPDAWQLHEFFRKIPGVVRHLPP